MHLRRCIHAVDNIVDLNYSFFGWPHLAACVIAMAAFMPVIFARKGGRIHRTWGRVYAIAYAVACLTSLGIYRLQKFWFPHWLAIAGLSVLAAGYVAARYKPRGWRYIHLTTMLLSAYNLFGGAVNEAFLRIKPLTTLTGGNPFASPLYGVTHSLLMMTFLVLLTAYVVLTAARSPRRANSVVAKEGAS
jgi:uncharacterized membrane protein